MRHRSRCSVLPLLLGAALVALAAITAAGCASAPAERADMARALRSRGLDPATVVIPHEITDEMRAWVHREVPDSTPADQRLSRLLAAIIDPGGLQVRYEARHTATAKEVFQSRRANCLAFTSLFVGLAREIGVPVSYLDVDDVEKFEKEGDLVVVSGHVSAGYNSGSELKILDFSAAPTVQYRKVHIISDLTGVALFYSNLGAEALRGGKTEEALGWLRKGVVIDPDLGRAWVNYGVALRRAGDTPGAEAAYRKALEVEPTAVSAYQNLAALLRLRGEDAEAGDLLALSDRLGTRNPFIYLALGDLSLAHGRMEDARRFYRKSLHLYHDSAEPYAAMGLLSLATGDSADAARWLRKAVAIDQENERVRQLAGRLGHGGRG
jgi:Flp pilus assembly protein TadD